MAKQGFRYELWVPLERAKEARDAIFVEFNEWEGEPRRAADVPATPDTLAYATFYIDMEFFGLLGKRSLRRTDEDVGALARRLGGNVYRYPITEIHVTVHEKWAPMQRLG